jgi:hypothetical protein
MKDSTPMLADVGDASPRSGFGITSVQLNEGGTARRFPSPIRLGPVFILISLIRGDADGWPHTSPHQGCMNTNLQSQTAPDWLVSDGRRFGDSPMCPYLVIGLIRISVDWITAVVLPAQESSSNQPRNRCDRLSPGHH